MIDWKQLRRGLVRHSAQIGLFAVIVITISRAASVMRYPIAVGIDGYYYVLQITSFATHHHFYFPTKTPLTLFFLIAINTLTRDPVWTIKIGSTMLLVMLSLGVFAMVTSVTRNIWPGLLGSALLIIPQSHFYMTTEYLNQLGAIVLLMWAGWSAVRAAQRRRRIDWVIVAALLVTSFLSHRSALILAAAIAFCVLLVTALNRGVKYRILALLATLILWLGPAIISVQPFFTVPDWLQKQISIRPHWPVEQLLVAEELMLALSSLMVFGFVVWQAKQRKLTTLSFVFGSIALFSLLVTLNPFLSADAMLSSVAGRLRVLAFIQVALLLSSLIFLAYTTRRAAALYLAGIFLPLLILSAVAPAPRGVRQEFLVRRAALIDGLKSHLNELGSKPMIIAPHGDQFVITATTGVPSQQRPPVVSQYDRVYWLLNDVENQTLTGSSIGLFRNHATDTLLVEDSTFKRHWLTMSPFDKSRLLRTNPNLNTIQALLEMKVN